MINQLFRKEPDREILLDLINAFGYQNLNQIDQPFTKNDLETRKTIDKLQKLKPKLEEYYIPCKAKNFLNKKITVKNALTILRQFIKCEGYYLNYWETYIKGKKVTYYQIKEDEKVKKSRKYVINFS